MSQRAGKKKKKKKDWKTWDEFLQCQNLTTLTRPQSEPIRRVTHSSLSNQAPPPPPKERRIVSAFPTLEPIRRPLKAVELQRFHESLEPELRAPQRTRTVGNIPPAFSPPASAIRPLATDCSNNRTSSPRSSASCDSCRKCRLPGSQSRDQDIFLGGLSGAGDVVNSVTPKSSLPEFEVEVSSDELNERKFVHLSSPAGKHLLTFPPKQVPLVCSWDERFNTPRHRKAQAYPVPVHVPLCNSDILLSSSGAPPPTHTKPEQVTLRSSANLSGGVMATASFRTSGDARRPNRHENRPPTNAVLCRNGPHCRKFLEGTCSYNHDFTSMAPNGLNNALVAGRSKRVEDGLLSQDSSKKSLNVDSPAFTPKTGSTQPAKIGISPKAATAAAFTPRGSGSVTPAAMTHSKEPSAESIQPQTFPPVAQQFQEFVPGGQTFLTSPQMETPQPMQHSLNAFGDTFLTPSSLAGLDTSQAQINPYAPQSSVVANQTFFADASSFKHPLNYHLYASIGPRRENLLNFQRSTTDFFIADDLREDLQRKSEATLQTYANSTLPPAVEYFHSLVAIEANSGKGAIFGYPTWVYKAVSSRDGNTYALRRVEGYKLPSEVAIKPISAWRRITNSSMVRIHDAFTGRWFGDSSLVIVTDYHPNSKTLADKHSTAGRAPHKPAQITPENELWSYIVQLASALKSIHEGGLAAQTMVPSKVLVTSKNRLRLNGCGVLDVINYEQQRPLHELQRADLQSLGRLILGIAARNPSAHENASKALQLVSRSYSERIRACIAWLLAPPPLPHEADPPADPPAPNTEYNIHTLLNNIADKVVASFDSALHHEDDMTFNLGRELENGRIVRLLMKLNVILERPDLGGGPTATNNPALFNQPSAAWSETGDRYYLKLFRDYVFHQVDHEGRPVLDLGHMITCLNKLDAGIDEKIQLVSRNEQDILIVSYKEVKRGFEAAWVEISKASNPARR